MIRTFSLVCRETQRGVWIGQGSATMTRFYGGDPNTMQALLAFLVDHMGKALELVCDDTDLARDEYGIYEVHDGRVMVYVLTTEGDEQWSERGGVVTDVPRRHGTACG